MRKLFYLVTFLVAMGAVVISSPGSQTKTAELTD